MTWQSLNHFERPFVAVNQAINTDDNGPGLYMRGWLPGACANVGGWLDHTLAALKEMPGLVQVPPVTVNSALKEMPGLVQVPPVTVNSLAYGKDSMPNHDYQGLELNLPV
jgi:hypothetical protein